MPQPEKRLYTLEKYLSMEESGEYKSEYYHSESTKDYDRGSKFTAYRNIKTLMDYILVDQDEVHIEYFHKSESGNWVLEEYKEIQGDLDIYSIDLKISIKTIYDRVEW